MRKTFALSHPKIKPARLVDAIKHEVKKYVKRERNKTLPEDVDFWDFDCKFGPKQEDAKDIHLAEINKYIDQAVADGLESFYLEVMVKEANRHYEPRAQEPAESASENMVSENMASEHIDESDDDESDNNLDTPANDS